MRDDSARKPVIAVIGAGACDEATEEVAFEVGRHVALAGCVLATGGLGGVMEAASGGASAAGGIVLGILPGADPGGANGHVQVVVATGMGDARNAILCNTADAFVAVAGELGTLSEIAFALKRGKPVVGLGSWEHPRLELVPARSPQEAVELAAKALRGRG